MGISDPFINSLFHIQVTLPLILTTQSWSIALQQALLFVLILGRWLLPKGELTRDQLSQLLLVYIGIAADILEFVTENLKLEQVKKENDTIFWNYDTIWVFQVFIL